MNNTSRRRDTIILTLRDHFLAGRVQWYKESLIRVPFKKSILSGSESKYFFSCQHQKSLAGVESALNTKPQYPPKSMNIFELLQYISSNINNILLCM